ncbi:diguanylate cyclase [Lysinibacillus xylanilyticus]|uniref:sensor domain-containing diguanylate cyclase n=1 Tax=Lysinibacillus xylanilyticus TaxID=582475 RepID=UPI0037F60B58
MTNWTYFALGFITGIIILFTCMKCIKAKKTTNFKDNGSILKLVEMSKDIIYYYELKPEYKHCYTTPSVDYFLGEGTLDILNSDPNMPFKMVHPDDLVTINQKVMDGADYSKGIIQRFRGTNGIYRWFEEFTTPIYKNGELVAIQGVMRNIDEKVKLEQDLKYQITHDPLTNLYNRGYFEEKMNKYNKEVNTSISIMLCDLDELKYINDNFGHKQGDELICATAEILVNYFPQEAVVARIGGDEFVIIQAGITDAQICTNYEGLQSAIDIYSINHEMRINISIGYAVSEQSINKMEQLFVEADQKMYEQKRAKKQIVIRS